MQIVRKIILGILMVLGLVSISFAASEFKDMGKEGPGIVCPIDFQNMTTEEIQEQLQLRLANLEDEYASCEDEQLRTRIQERIEMTQGLIDDPEKLEEMITNMPEEMPERKGNGFKIDFQNMTTEEIQEQLQLRLANLEDEYASCEDEQLRTRIQERIEMTQGLIDDPEKLEEMITNMPEDTPERKGECQKANFE
ncbi:possible (U93872) ORF 73, contains large complex repeat CR 73 [Human herpesvirus 8] [Methanococcus maripaludis S2]|uniref:Possible (U93872) ORF 73, contains large complex repeat CR 73 [Human herpesvirus 8] n=2 Tax=Methanococcus maripaludis TaxID=39152 RepID=Q6LZU9_METMP|nr:possible (U93872) ORF 73, contains large complex repeat CR 73 [Human herpesvirus 8] [Methanococcus maripaludis S2]